MTFIQANVLICGLACISLSTQLPQDMTFAYLIPLNYQTNFGNLQHYGVQHDLYSAYIMADPNCPPCPAVSTFLGVEPLLALGAAGGLGVEPLLQPRGNGLQQGSMVYPFLGAEGFV